MNARADISHVRAWAAAISLLLLAALGGCGGGAASSPSTDSGQAQGHPSAAEGGANHSRPHHRSSPSRAKPKVLVPSVIGADPATARLTLADHDLRAGVVPDTPTYGSCGDRVTQPLVAPTADSEVVGQWPEAGSHIGSGREVDLATDAHVQTTCRASSALPPCSPDELSLRVKPDYPDTAGGSELGQLTVMVRNTESHRACRVSSSIATSIEAPEGTLPSAISGDPATLRVRAALPPGRELQATWVWYGPWCGSKDVIGSVSVDGLHVTTPMGRYRPTCYHAGNSRLGSPSLVLYRHPPGG